LTKIKNNVILPNVVGKTISNRPIKESKPLPKITNS
jgi:hypothetical protein